MLKTSLFFLFQLAPLRLRRTNGTTASAVWGRLGEPWVVPFLVYEVTF